MDEIDDFYSLHGAACSLIVDCRSGSPGILYFGARLGAATRPEMLAALFTRQEAQASVEKELPIGLAPEFGAGFLGNAAVHVHRDGRQWGTNARLVAVRRQDGNALEFVSRCDGTQLEITHTLRLDRASNVLTGTTSIRNLGSGTLRVEQCNAPSIPLPPQFALITGFEGRWSREFQRRRVRRFHGSYLRENRSGRTSHDSFPGFIVHAADTTEAGGEAIGLHFGWSGNHHARIEQLSSGLAHAQFGELFYPGELILEPGERYTSPALYGAFSDDGFSGVSRHFHRYVRQHLRDARATRPRPVHFNTWEAVYFDMSEPVLERLVDAAADLGVERFVLDDGWFRNRKSDRAGLGDWYVDELTFPQGLSPLVEHVNRRGMEFGLWIEPEMVNPDSDLYRAHPDWVLDAKPAPAVMARHQLVLDLGRPEVQSYLFERIDALLTEYRIDYLKWDMNRDLNQPGGHDGRAAAHGQTLALYELIRRVRTAHPAVEIESCASGGGRADFGVLAHTDRIWTSDNNDALERLQIQRGFSCFFPAEVMGAHVGPAECHITGRTLSLALRAGVAMFGHFGIEADLLALTDPEKAELRDAVSWYKKYRALIHSGELHRLDTDDHECAFGIVDAAADEALFSYALVGSTPFGAPGRLRFHGLQADKLYTIRVVWPLQPRSYSKSVLDVLGGLTVSGESLLRAGMQLPILKPESVLVLHLQAVDRQ